MVASGWADVYIYDGKPFTRTAAYQAAAKDAKTKGRGAWRHCDGDFHGAS